MIFRFYKLIIFFSLIVFSISCKNNAKAIKQDNETFEKLELKKGGTTVVWRPKFPVR